MNLLTEIGEKISPEEIDGVLVCSLGCPGVIRCDCSDDDCPWVACSYHGKRQYEVGKGLCVPAFQALVKAGKHFQEASIPPRMVEKVDLGILLTAYGWTLDVDGNVCGLVAGDMGYAPTGIKIPKDHLDAFIDSDPRVEALVADVKDLNQKLKEWDDQTSEILATRDDQINVVLEALNHVVSNSGLSSSVRDVVIEALNEWERLENALKQKREERFSKE